MLCFIIFLVCAVVCVVALSVWLVGSSVLAFLTCIERSLTNLGNGHAIVGALYLIPAWLFVCALAQFISLAISFWQAVIK
jgi:hypothetical protein